MEGRRMADGGQTEGTWLADGWQTDGRGQRADSRPLAKGSWARLVQHGGLPELHTCGVVDDSSHVAMCENNVWPAFASTERGAAHH